MKGYRKVNKKELERFIDDYPNDLVWDVTGICEPPMGSYNDFTGGKVWPASIVAKVKFESVPEHYIKIEEQEND